MKPFQNDQEFFDAAVAHLRRQQAQSMQVGSCLYYKRTRTGYLACAIGGVLPIELLLKIADTPLNSDTSVKSLIRENTEVKELFANVTPQFAIVVQDLHDSYEPPQWEVGFKRLAREWDVSVPAWGAA